MLPEASVPKIPWLPLICCNWEIFNEIQAIDRFRGNENSILIATDVAARGLDIPNVRTVIHYQLPHSAEASVNSQHCCIFFFYYCYKSSSPVNTLCFRFMFTGVEELLELLRMDAALH